MNHIINRRHPFFDVNGNCYIVGRKDDTVKVSGFRVNLSDVDSYIHKFEYVKDSVTICIEYDDKPNYLVSFIALDKTSSINSSKIRKDLKLHLPSFQIPKYIELIKDIINHSGKVCKKTLNEFLKNMIFSSLEFIFIFFLRFLWVILF